MHKQQSGVGQPIPNQSIISCCIKILAQRRKRLSIPRWLFGRRGAPWESLQTTTSMGLDHMTYWRWSWFEPLYLCNMRIWKSSGVYLSCRRFGPPLCQLHLRQRLAVLLTYPLITILVPSYYHLVSSTYGSEMQHLQKRVPRFVRQQLSCSHCFRLHWRGLGFQHRICKSQILTFYSNF